MGLSTFDCKHIVTKISSLPGIVITSFDVASKNKSVLGHHWTTIVVDECHKLKGDGCRSHAIMPMLQSADHLLLLTGTPQQSKPLELYNLLASLQPVVFQSKLEFMNRYCDGQLNSWGEWEAKGSLHEEELFFMLQHMMIRYRTEDVITDLPAMHRELIHVKMTEPDDIDNMVEMKMRYKTLCMQMTKETDPFKKRQLSHQLGQHSIAMWRETECVKARICSDMILEDILKHPNDKYVIWSKQVTVLRIFEDLLCDIPTITVTGCIPPIKRSIMIDSLVDPEGVTRVGLMTMDSCGEGLNFVPGVSRMWFVGMDHTPSLMFQAEKRAHRKGCTKEVFSKWLFLEDSHDTHVLGHMESKQELNDRIIDGSISGTQFF
jgi:SWI/SNF-related matrix-associated actin-dependent regulator of chromatin subfamily A-like protein 1